MRLPYTYAGIVAASALLLSGCANRIPPLELGAADWTYANVAAGDDIDSQMRGFKAYYARSYGQVTKDNDAARIGGLVLAAVAAVVTLNAAASAATSAASTAKTLGYIGIGSVGYSAGRGILAPAGLGAAYIGGYKAMSCLLSERPHFIGASGLQQHADFQRVLGQTRSALQDLIMLTAAVPGARQDALKGALAIAAAAQAQAETAVRAGERQQLSWMGQDSVFREAFEDAKARVAEKAANRPAELAFRDQVAAFYTPPPPAAAADDSDGKGKTQGLTALKTAEDWQQAIATAVAKLGAETSILLAGTPDYTGAISRVRACPAKIA